MQLLNNGVPNNAAAALFGSNIYEYPQFRLRMARFRGTNKNEFIDSQRAEGNFFDLLDAGMAFFFKHLSLSGKIVGFVRKEYLEIPAEALRETLVNALCHRQYEKYNLTIGIAICDDRIEIENPGMLPPQLTPETIKQPHISYPYNPIIADVLFKTTFLENWGSGAERIFDACKQQNVQEPIWSAQGGFVIVTFKRPSKDSSTIQVQTLIESMSNDYMTMNEMMEACGMKSRMRFRDNYVTPALEDRAIERKYPNQPKYPKQQYRLTEKAKAWKQVNNE